jgi:iron complex outermembrane receptor protein
VVGAVVRAVLAVPLLFGAVDAFAEPGPAAPASDELAEIVVSGDRLDVIPTKPIDSVFGFGKTVLETPRSLTTISHDLLEKTIITGINDLVALSPGAFTQSFFGVAGSLDVRGSPGENYFRGMRRISNPGNYPTAIAASDSIDIVRGPASPIYGPSQIGGYLNFVPRSARKDDGTTLTDEIGKIEYTGGSWGKKTLSAEVGGPANLFGKDLGYYLYGQSEDSNSYYENTHTRQSILQTAFNMDFTPTFRTEFGGMYQHFKGNQVAGWNRLTQALINNGTYITGSPSNLDTNGDGLLSQSESAAGGLTSGPFYVPGFGETPAQLAAAIAAAGPNFGLVNPGTTHITGNQVLVSPLDDLSDDVITLYFDLYADLAGGFKLQNKAFYEYLKNNNLNAYGFSQYADTYAIEDQFIVSNKWSFGDMFDAAVQVSPSIRYSGFEHGDDFSDEYFDRRDITGPSTPVDHRTLAVLGQDAFSDHTRGKFTDYGFAVLSDMTLAKKLDLLVGGRYDYITMASRQLADVIGVDAEDPAIDSTWKHGGFSYSASLSYELPFGMHPYATYAKQSTLILGQGGQIDPANVEGHKAVGDSNLKEVGIKATELDGHLYLAVDYFNQRRVDFSAQDTVTNNATKASGIEFEARWVVNPLLTITSAYTNMKVVNLTGGIDGSQFSYMGGQQLLDMGINPAAVYGSGIGQLVPYTGSEPRKAGIPQQVYGLNFLGSADPWVAGLSGTVALQHVSSVPSGFAGDVTLPKYTLVNLGARYERGKWAMNLACKNATDARYFRSNFPDLFGSSVVLPELPRNYSATLQYKF